MQLDKQRGTGCRRNLPVNLYCWCCLGMLFALHGCGGASTATPPAMHNQERLPSTEQREPDDLQKFDPLSTGLTGGMPRGAEAWQQFIADGRYRIARADDFNFSEAAKKKGGLDIEHRIKFPYIEGDFNYDYISKDRAVIVVDTTRSDAERFGLVIFNASEDVRDIPQPHWLYRERDLSKTVLSWSRDGLGLMEYREDGAFVVCHVKWDKQQRKYSCS